MYRRRINNIENSSLEELIKDCRNHVPMQYRMHPYRHPELNHGVDLLRTEESLDCYMSAYGEMHQMKCRAAIQNFPFENWNITNNNNDSFGGSIEIVDWGCGQGIGSLTFIEALKDRDIVQWLKKVTLIEPSEAALDRAKSNVLSVTKNSIRVDDINKFLPGYGDEERVLSGLSYSCKSVVHIFSNILDVEGVDLSKVAQMVVASGNNHYILCVGPMNANSFKIDRFYEIFGKPNVFSDIASKNYSFTSNTHYPYTCKTKGFLYDGRNLDLSRYNPAEKAISKVYGEYDINLHISNGVLSYDKAWVYYRLESGLCQDDIIYIEPELNGAKPDFVIVRPNYGIIIVDVFEQEFSESDVNEGKLEMLISTLGKYQDIFIGSLSDLTDAVIDDNRNLSLVKKMLVCTKYDTKLVNQYFKNKNYTAIYGKEFIECESSNLYKTLRLDYRNSIFNERVTRRFIHLLSPDWHSYREGKVINLTPAQSELAKSVPSKMQKISGTAGSGKTQVMCTRAVNAQLRTGGRVLILAYNIALINYLRIRLSEIRADFSWNRIDLDYYHRFFRQYAHKNNLKVEFNSYDNLNFFDEVKDSIEKYDAIFIDEVQDYSTVWLELLKKVFLKPEGEFVVFGDPAQNIYNRELDVYGDIKIGVIPGVWNKTLTKSKRFSNPVIARLANDFRNTFGMTENKQIENENVVKSEGFSFNYVKYSYLNYSRETNLERYAENVYNEIFQHLNVIQQEKEPEIKNVAIISPHIDILKELEAILSDRQRKTTITFVSKKNEVKILRGGTFADYRCYVDYKREERLLKLTFTTDTEHIKLSTIQSFKGWESPTVFLLIMCDKDCEDGRIFNNPQLIYTGITRAKENLVVINLGNEKYDEFFRTKIE